LPFGANQTCREYFKIDHERKPKSTTTNDYFDRSHPVVFHNNTVIYSVNNTTYIGN